MLMKNSSWPGSVTSSLIASTAVFSLLISMVVCLFGWSTPAYALSVATVDGRSYDSLQDAVDAISSEGTIVITSDITLTPTAKNTAGYCDVGVKIPASKNITITDDGNPHVISAPDGVGAFLVEEGATLTLAASRDDALIIQAGNFTDLSKAFLFAGTAVENEGTFNLVSGTIKGAHITGTHAGTIFQRNTNAVFTMSGGVIRDTVVDQKGSYYCSAILMEGGVMNMSGGLITKNTNHSGYFYNTGGAISFVVTKTNDVPLMYADFNMSGGEISHNTTDGLGGGIAIGAYTNVHMTGGTISDNYADYMGGGMALTGLSEYSDYTASGYSETGFEPTKGTFVMDGGTIKNNTSRNGGGMYVNSDGATLNAGLFEGNKAVFDQSDLAFYDIIPHNSDNASDVGWGHGGAIYVSEQPRTLHINKAIITENTAIPQGHSAMGGGLWVCPTGTVDFRVTNGVAIFNNTAKTDDTPEASAAGDDVAKVSLDNAYSTITLPGRLLGSGQVTWYNDGGITPSSVGSADTTAKRYDSSNPGEPISIDTSHENLAVKAVVSPEAVALAENEATLIIRNNTASHGGGVATNGNIVSTNLDEPDWSLTATKIWDSSVDEEDKQPVELFLKLGDKILDSQIASSENNWTVTFTGLPNPASLSLNDFSIVEGTRVVDSTTGISSVEKPSAWQVSYGEVTQDASKATIYASVTNSSVPPIVPTPSTVDITAHKAWDDTALGDTVNPIVHPTIYLKLYRTVGDAESEEVPGAALGRLENGVLDYTWKGLEKTDAEGDAYTYSVREVDEQGKDSVPTGYTKTESGLTVTNTAQSPKSSTNNPDPNTSSDTTEKTLDQIPETGDSPMLVWGALVCVSAAGVALWSRRRFRER